MIMVIMVSGFHLGQRAWSKGERDVGRNQRFRFGIETLVRDISSTYNARTRIANEWITLFIGKPDSIHFVSSIGANLTHGLNIGLHQVAYYLGEGDDDLGPGLVREEFPIDNSNPFAEETSSRITLLPNIEEIAFEYLYRKPQQRRGRSTRMQLSTAEEAEDEWVEYWGGAEGEGLDDLRLAIHPGMDPEISRDSRRQPPVAVKVTLTFGVDPDDELSKPYTLPPIVIPIHVQTEY